MWHFFDRYDGAAGLVARSCTSCGGGSLFAAPAAPVRRAKPTASPRKKKRKRDSASKEKRNKNKQKCEASTENVSNKAKRVPKKACVRAGEVKKKKKKKKKKKSNNK